MLTLLPLLLLTAPAPQNTTYGALKQRIASDRVAFQRRYERSDLTGRKAILDSARTYLFDRITVDLLPAWYGTPWDFNGTTRIPGQGKIACGYFVNTILQDAGFNLPRIKWSQEAAEPITLKLTSTIKRFRDRPVSEVDTYIRSQGDGLYKVGLDSHVGFIVMRNGVVRFVHSNYYQRAIGVMSEPLEGNNPLADSRYRIVGTLLGDAMVEAWITGRDLDRDRLAGK